MRSAFCSLTCIIAALTCCWTGTLIHANPPAGIKVEVRGGVASPGAYKLKDSATIDEAFAIAGGWKSPTEVPDLVPAHECAIRHASGQKATRVRVDTDQAGKITFKDKAWKHRPLSDGDTIIMLVVAW